MMLDERWGDAQVLSSPIEDRLQNGKGAAS